MPTATPTATPLVSMIVPVYNSVSYLAETLDSLLTQGLSESELEVIIVDDGSDDGSETMADEYAQRHSHFRVIHQAQSGGPASPCNEGVWASRGKYFFLLGADDVMTPNSLRELVDVAEREGSDVVLAKLGSLGGRRTPGSVYKKTVYDADLVEHKIFNTLSAVKLFRRELVERTGAYHPPHLRVGSDQPFVAALYLAASRFSICADREFVLIRRRTDGSNITRTFRSPVEYADLASAVLSAIVTGTEPGALRDGIVRRTFRRELPPILGAAFLDLPEDEQRRVADRVREMLAPVYHDVTAPYIEPLTRTKVDLAIAGDLESLQEVIAWQSRGETRAVHDGARFRYPIPPELAARIGEHRIHPPVVRGEVTLTGVSCRGRVVELRATVLAEDCRTPAPVTLLRLRHRGTDEAVDIPTQVERPVDAPSGSGNAVRAAVDLREFTSGVWDAYMVQRFGDDEILTRFGAKRSEQVDAESIYLFPDGGDAPPLGKLYFTRGPENLSIDLGFTHTQNDLPEASVRGVIDHSGASELAILAVTSRGSVTYHVPADGGATSRSTRAAHSTLSGGLVCVVLPSDLPHSGPARRLILQDGDATRSIPLPPSAEPGIAPAGPAGSQTWREGERTGDILRQAVDDLRVVGRRSARRVRQEATSLPQRVRGVLGPQRR